MKKTIAALALGLTFSALPVHAQEVTLTAEARLQLIQEIQEKLAVLMAELMNRLTAQIEAQNSTLEEIKRDQVEIKENTRKPVLGSKPDDNKADEPTQEPEEEYVEKLKLGRVDSNLTNNGQGASIYLSLSSVREAEYRIKFEFDGAEAKTVSCMPDSNDIEKKGEIFVHKEGRNGGISCNFDFVSPVESADFEVKADLIKFDSSDDVKYGTEGFPATGTLR